MFSYYGAKTNIVDLYPIPKFDKIIEPFAGSARYSLKYWEKDILLVDKYPVIVEIWHFLQKASENDIKKLPILKKDETVHDFNLTEIEKKLVGFYAKRGNSIPCIKASDRTIIHRPNAQKYQRDNIASQLYKIKHWNIKLADYTEIENENATWFIDPPYMFGGQSYKFSNKNINFMQLAEWCKSRNGQIIVCENTKADWLNFKPMVKMKGSIFRTTEAIWSNYPTEFDYQMQSLF